MCSDETARFRLDRVWLRLKTISHSRPTAPPTAQHPVPTVTHVQEDHQRFPSNPRPRPSVDLAGLSRGLTRRRHSSPRTRSKSTPGLQRTAPQSIDHHLLPWRWPPPLPIMLPRFTTGWGKPWPVGSVRRDAPRPHRPPRLFRPIGDDESIARLDGSKGICAAGGLF